MIVAVAAVLMSGHHQDTPRPYWDGAAKAATWIQAQLVKGSSDDVSLYSGLSGVLVFTSEMVGAQQSLPRLRQVDGLARNVIALSSKTQDSGLYTGLCGSAFALQCAGLATGKEEYRQAAIDCLDRVVAKAKTVGKGVQWNDSNDIISGSAGIGCTLVWASSALDNPTYLDTAKKVGDRLIELAQIAPGGLKWAVGQASGDTGEMPNFSHGTAGIAYFLAQLGAATGDSKYVAAAEQGAGHLIELSQENGLVYHDDSKGKDLFYLGWCHGPVGTARLFAVLQRVTHKEMYGAWIARASEAVKKSGIPETRTPGFWNNFGLCCGDAGVEKFYLDLAKSGAGPQDATFARRLADFLLSRGRPEGDGLKWVFAENRVQPDDQKAQTGLMEGAAGIGLALLWMDGYDQKRPSLAQFPDSPWHG